jgi:hypothetical protein
MGRPFVDLEQFPMLRVCSEAGCKKVVFGGGTCVEHDGVPERMRTTASAAVPALASSHVGRVSGAVPLR